MTKRDQGYDSLFQAWNQAQRQMFGLWTDWLNSGNDSLTELLQGQLNLLQGPDPTSGSKGSALSERTATDALAGQGALKELIDLSLGAWQTAIAGETSTEKWAERAADFAQQWIDTNLKNVFDLGVEKDNKPHLWKVFLGQLPALWSGMLGGSPGTPAEAAGQDSGQHPWLTLQDGWDPLPWLAGEIAQLPHVGAIDTTLGRKMLQGFETWYVFVRAEQKHQLIRLKAWSGITLRASRRLATLAQAGKRITTSRDWLLLWIDAGDDVLIDMYRSEEYLQIQRELMAATMSYKKWLQEFGGLVLEAYGCPTRAELNDAYRAIYELRRELRSLKKDLRAQAATQQQTKQTAQRKRAAKSTPPKQSPTDTGE